jgi:valyl-tRNA synthetase
MEDLPKAYDAKLIESKWYAFWEKEGFFVADPTSGKAPYTIALPPPNVTGVLHVGHALGNTLQDILIRYMRMCGKEVLWMPGTDHAGIATQTVIERQLLKTENKRRTDYSREQFVKIVWAWKEKSEKQIIEQLKRQGVSCDWSRMRFTMDRGYDHAVRFAFKALFDQGLIYRGDYLVNWDPVTKTALADDEVEYEDRNGFLWHIAYPIENSSCRIVIATTRPETLLGDTAIAVHPEDMRYRECIGNFAILPLVGRRIPIIADMEVNQEFGTGALKVTPAHDPNDWIMGERHNLEVINIMTDDGHINENGGKFKGLTMEEAREAVLKELKTQGLLVKCAPYTNRVGVSYRSKATIEPHLSKQWFMKMSAFKNELYSLVEEKKTTLIPPQWNATYFHWIENLRDWCISRQLWWGHQIPIWYHKKSPDTILCYDGEGDPPEVIQNPEDWVQDPDVLDTWFSSSLWPFATLGWPEKTPELEKFFPTSCLVTGHDILFFWVARMMMMSSIFMKKAPFKEVALTGIIYGKSYYKTLPEGGISYSSQEERKAYDLGAKPVPKDVICKWEKMSKSKGNVIDPSEIIEEYGADAMRLALASCATSNPQIDLDRRRFEEYKNFANKLWNGARFVFMNIKELSKEEFEAGLKLELFSCEDRWILSRYNRAIESVRKGIEEYQFDFATENAYDFFWNELCAYYVEIVKPYLFGKVGSHDEKKNKQKLLVILLSGALRLLHPMAPFITEELFARLKEHFGVLKIEKGADLLTEEAISALSSPACMKAPFPKKIGKIDEESEAQFELFSKIIYAIRNIRGEMKIPLPQATDLCISCSDEKVLDCIRKHCHIITSLVRIEKVAFSPPPSCPGSLGQVDAIKLFIPMPETMMEQERARLEKEAGRLDEAIERAQKQLANSQFLEKAPPELIEKHKENLMKMKQERENIKKEFSKK